MKSKIIILSIIAIYYFLIRDMLYNAFVILFIDRNDPRALLVLIPLAIPWLTWLSLKQSHEELKRDEEFREKVQDYMDKNPKQ